MNVIKSVILLFNNFCFNDVFCIFWIKVKEFCDENNIVLITPSTGGG